MPNPQVINDGSMALKGFFRDVWVDKRLEDMSLEMQLHSSVARCFFRWFLTTGYLMELAGPCPWAGEGLRGRLLFFLSRLGGVLWHVYDHIRHLQLMKLLPGDATRSLRMGYGCVTIGQFAAALYWAPLCFRSENKGNSEGKQIASPTSSEEEERDGAGAGAGTGAAAGGSSKESTSTIAILLLLIATLLISRGHCRCRCPCRHRPPRALQGVTRHLPDGAHLACLALARFTSGRILDHQGLPRHVRGMDARGGGGRGGG